MDHVEEHTPVIAGERDRGGRRGWRDRPWYDHIPWLTYVLIVYVVIKLVGLDVRAVWFADLLPFTWAELLPVAAAGVGMRELRRVAIPGVNNLHECFEMAAVTGIQFALMLLAWASVQGLSIFGTMEFFWLFLVSAFQTYSAFTINAATLLRTIAPSGN